MMRWAEMQPWALYVGTFPALKQFMLKVDLIVALFNYKHGPGVQTPLLETLLRSCSASNIPRLV